MSEARDITEHLIEEGTAARAHFQVWLALRNLAVQRLLPAMNDLSYVDFFHASNSGHYKLFFIALSKIFDRDQRVAGISELKKTLRADGRTDLALYIARELKPVEKLIVRMMRIRNKSIAHTERRMPRTQVYKINGITPNQIRQVIDQVCSVINHVATDLGISNTIFESDRLEKATLRMLETLRRGQLVTKFQKNK